MGKPAWQSYDYRKEAKARKEIEKMNRANDQTGLITVMRDAPSTFIRVAAAQCCNDCDALINVALKENEAFHVRAEALESIGKTVIARILLQSFPCLNQRIIFWQPLPLFTFWINNGWRKTGLTRWWNS